MAGGWDGDAHVRVNNIRPKRRASQKANADRDGPNGGQQRSSQSLTWPGRRPGQEPKS
jgi:hypothetical protein